jgi:hypothetical protein
MTAPLTQPAPRGLADLAPRCGILPPNGAPTFHYPLAVDFVRSGFAGFPRPAPLAGARRKS